MSEMGNMVCIYPTPEDLVGLLGKWVVCRMDYRDGEMPHDSNPARVVGVVIPAPGSTVKAQLLVDKGEGDAKDGYQYELFLEYITYLRVIEPVEGHTYV